MEEKFRNKYRTTSFRKPNWDYGSHGLYFITICTKDRIHYFGEMEDIYVAVKNAAAIKLSEIGKIAFRNWMEIPQHFPFIKLDEFVIMPNHIHAILFINKPHKTSWEINKFGSQSKNLGSVLRGYKASVKKFATLNAIGFCWQSKYHDRVIRDENEYQSIKHYIINNPNKWLSDPDNILFT